MDPPPRTPEVGILKKTPNSPKFSPPSAAEKHHGLAEKVVPNTPPILDTSDVKKQKMDRNLIVWKRFVCLEKIRFGKIVICFLILRRD